MTLPPLPQDFGATAVVYGAPTVPPLSVVVECCGNALEATFDRWSQGYETRHQQMRRVESRESVGHDSTASPDGDDKKEKSKAKKKATATKMSESEIEEDHYGHLGYPEGLGVAATEEELRKICRQRALETHPDKTGGDDTMFKKVQLASDVLLNSGKRRAYDSSLPFDDDIPPLKVAADKFYRCFGSCFAANSRWFDGKKENIPSIGDDDTPLDVVEKFYDFWFCFKTWRDFSHEVADDLYDLQEADDRWERRRMERENAKFLEKAKKREKTRLTELTERAFKNDPRLLARDRAIQAEKVAKAEAKKRDEEERIRSAREAEEKRKRDEEEAKAAAKDLKGATKKSRQNFRKLVGPVEAAGGWPSLCSYTRTELDWFLGRSDYKTISALTEKARPLVDAPVEDGTQPLAFLLQQEIEAEEQRSGETRSGLQLSFREGFWGCDEIKKLYTAWSKSNGGEAEGWAAEMEPKSEEECLKKVQLLEKVSKENSVTQAAASEAAAKRRAEEAAGQKQLEAEEAEKAKRIEAKRLVEEEAKSKKARASAEQKVKKDQAKVQEHEGSKRRTHEKEEGAERTTLWQQYSTTVQRFQKERAKVQAVESQKRAKDSDKELKKIAKQMASNDKQEEDRRSALQEKEDKEFGQLLEKEKVDQAEAKKAKKKPAPKAAAKPAPKAAAKPAPKAGQKAAPKPAPKNQAAPQQQQPKPAAKAAAKPAPKPAPKTSEPAPAPQAKPKPQAATDDWEQAAAGGGKKKKK